MKKLKRNSMSLYFENYAAKGNEIINMLSKELNVSQDSAGRILRSTLHALRNRISLTESFHVLSQLPMAIKGIYVDGWNPHESIKRLRNRKDLINEIRNEDGLTSPYDFGDDEKTTKIIKGVFRTLSYHISIVEMQEILHALPAELKIIINESIGIHKAAL